MSLFFARNRLVGSLAGHTDSDREGGGGGTDFTPSLCSLEVDRIHGLI